MKRMFKKVLSVLLVLTMVFGTVTFGYADVNWSDFSVEAEAVREDVFNYETNDGEVYSQEKFTPCKSERCQELAEKSCTETGLDGASYMAAYSGSSSGYLAGDDLFDAEVDKLLDGIEGNTSLTDEQKALLIHDRLALHCDYDHEAYESGTYGGQSKEEAIVDRLALCAGYANAYCYLLNKVGIETYYISSGQLDHGWNLVKIDGEFYHVDVTWDDNSSAPHHKYFLLSEEEIRKNGHDASDYQINDYYASKFGFDYPYDWKTLPPTGKKYDDYFWDSASNFQLIGNSIYYLDRKNNCLKSYDGTVICDGFDSLGSSLIYDGNNLFFYDVDDSYYREVIDGVIHSYNNEVIYKYDLWNSKSEIVLTLEKKQINGLEYENGKLYCFYYDCETREYCTEIIYYGDVVTNTIFYESRHDFGKENVVVGETIRLPSPKHTFEIEYRLFRDYEGNPKYSVDCLGWTTKSDSKTVEYPCGSSFTPTEDTVLYAVWPETTYFKIPEYVSDKIFNNSDDVYYDEEVFLGWSRDSDATTPEYYPGDTVTFSQDEYFRSLTYYYSIWTDVNNVQTQKINFKYATPNEVKIIDGYSLKLPNSTITRKIYYDANGGVGAPDTKEISLVCTGWSTSSDATTVEYPCGTVYKPEEDITLYAVWENSETTLSTTIPTRDGYKFLGWSTEYDATTASYAPGDTIDVSDGGVYLYAVWDIEGYTINYHANGGEVNPAEEKVAIGATTTLPTPEKSVRITFDTKGDIVGSYIKVVSLVCSGWSTSSSAATAEYACGSTYKPTADINLYSVWQKATADIDFYTPTKRGYSFLGWSTDSDATRVDYYPGDKYYGDKDVTLYAVWQKNQDVTIPATMPSVPSTTMPVEVPTEPTTEPAAEPTTNPTEPTNKPSEPSTTKPVVTVPVPSVEIRRPSQTEIKYGDSIILHANVENLPEGAYIEWNVDNDNFKIVSYSTERINCTVTPSANGSTVFTATVYDADGNEICSDTQIMTAKAGFFQKIIAFFKKLFGLTKVIPEAFKF